MEVTVKKKEMLRHMATEGKGLQRKESWTGLYHQMGYVT